MVTIRHCNLRYFTSLGNITIFTPTEDIENENSGFIDITYKDFSVSMVLLRNQKFKKNVMTFAGDKGFLFADYSSREVVISNNHEINEIQCPTSHDFKVILNNLVSAIHKKDTVIAGAEAGLHSLQTVLSVYKKIGSNSV